MSNSTAYEVGETFLTLGMCGAAFSVLCVEPVVMLSMLGISFGLMMVGICIIGFSKQSKKVEQHKVTPEREKNYVAPGKEKLNYDYRFFTQPTCDAEQMQTASAPALELLDPPLRPTLSWVN